MLSGISPDDIEKENIDLYRCAPINIQSIRFDWLLGDVAVDNKQPFVYRLLNEIMKKDVTEQDQGSEERSFYDIPVVQAMIRFHHSKLQQYIWSPFIMATLLLDLFQILAQMILINQLLMIESE